MRSMRYGVLALLAVACMGAEDCNGGSEADKIQSDATDALSLEATMQVGMPGINNFQERRLIKMLYELRDQADLSTWTYILDMNGNLHSFCSSIGYGIPYAVQFSNPERRMWDRYDSGTLPQPEPNGLFMPDALSATWVFCVSPEGTAKPVYVEPQIVVAPFKMK